MIPNLYSTNRLILQSLKVKRQIHKNQTFTGSMLFVPFLLESAMLLVQPYWVLTDVTYKDTKYNEWTQDIRYQVNDLLLVFSIFFKVYPLYKFIINSSQWNDSKAQRCCSILGVEANFMFGLKALMI